MPSKKDEKPHKLGQLKNYYKKLIFRIAASKVTIGKSLDLFDSANRSEWVFVSFAGEFCLATAEAAMK